jgi:DNA-binding response OmpR family regulator
MARVLISEADDDVRRLLVVMVERLGHEAIVLEPDVVVPPRVDLMLLDPEADACLDDARLLRAYETDVPVVCLGLVPDHGSFLRRGPLSFLPKPFTLDALRGSVQAVLAASPV